MATTNLCVAIFREILVRETIQTARYPEEDFWENGSQIGGDFQGVFPGWLWAMNYVAGWTSLCVLY